MMWSVQISYAFTIYAITDDQKLHLQIQNDLPLDCETLAHPCLFLQNNKVSIEPDAATGQKWQRFREISVFYFIIELNAQHVCIPEQEQRHSQQPKIRVIVFNRKTLP